MNLLPARLRSQEVEVERSSQIEFTLDEWAQYVNDFIYNGVGYVTLGGVNQTQPGQLQETIGPLYSTLATLAYQSDGIVFACMATRAMHFSEVRFQFRQLNNGRPGKLFGTQDLQPLEEPWAGATTGDLLTRMLMHADLSGNAFVVRRGDRLDLLRPDWVTIIVGSNTDPEAGAWAADAEIVGYVYSPGGTGTAAQYTPQFFLPSEVAHFAPTPDPLARFRGMSWLTPLIREVMADKAATEHKLRFFENPTPNMIVKFDVPSLEEFRESIKMFKQEHEGARNAYKYLFAASGTDATVVGSNLKDLDYKMVTGAGETRIAAAARTPPVIVGLSEGLAGSSLNSGNYQAARRMFADGCIRPLWRNAAGSLAHLINVPAGSELWTDDRDVAFLKEDLQERAQVMATKSQAIRFLVDSGYEPDSVITAVEAEDYALLVHSGLYSVQLQPANAPKQGLFQGVPVPVNPTDNSKAVGAADQINPATNGNGRSNEHGFTRAELAEILAARGVPPETHVHFDEGAFRFDVPSAPDVHIHEGAFTAEAPQVHMDAPQTTIEPGAVIVEGAAAPEIRMDLEPVADGLRALAEREPDNVTVEAPNVTVEPARVEVNVPERAVNVEAPETPIVNITNEVQTPEVTVNVPDQPPPVVTVNLEDEPLEAEVQFKRNPDGSLKSAQIKETGGDEADG